MSNDKQKHIKLLKRVPNECFNYADNIKARLDNGCQISYSNIELLYKDLALSLSKFPHTDSQRRKTVMEFDNYYKFSDYVNPRANHICGYVYKSKFLLPKVYKNAIINASPSNIAVFVEPKPGVSFQDANNLKTDFINVARTNNVVFMGEYLLDHLDNCYKKLNKLMKNGTFVPNKKFKTHQGSIVLNEELIDLFSNQNRILNANYEIHYAPNERIDVIEDVIRHKKAMFGELRSKHVR